MKNRYIAILLALLFFCLAIYVFTEVKQENTVEPYTAQEEQTVIMR